MSDKSNVRKTQASHPVWAAVVTLAGSLVAFAALDDITTGNETDFTQEYTALLGFAVWLLFLALRRGGPLR